MDSTIAGDITTVPIKVPTRAMKYTTAQSLKTTKKVVFVKIYVHWKKPVKNTSCKLPSSFMI